MPVLLKSGSRHLAAKKAPRREVVHTRAVSVGRARSSQACSGKKHLTGWQSCTSGGIAMPSSLIFPEPWRSMGKWLGTQETAVFKSLLILEPALNPCLRLSLLNYEMDLLKIITRIRWLLRTRTCNKGKGWTKHQLFLSLLPTGSHPHGQLVRSGQQMWQSL